MSKKNFSIKHFGQLTNLKVVDQTVRTRTAANWFYRQIVRLIPTRSFHSGSTRVTMTTDRMM